MRTFFPSNSKQLIQQLGKDKLLKILTQMLRIRNFETRAESAYLQGLVGGFFHSYVGQEAIQTAAVEVFGVDQWWITSYRCHALALLLGATPNEMMAEFYGRSTGNAKGRGGSMHLYTDRLMGGFGIVGGQIPIAAGAAFAAKYKEENGKVALGFLGDGAVVQGAFHEALNLAALWDLPLVTVIENNLWGMGTAVERAVSVERIAEDKAPGYGMKSYTLDGMDFFNCYQGFKHIFEQIKIDSRPVLVECVCERFKGHSISDPGLYRSRDELKESMSRDPITMLKLQMIEAGFLDEETYKQIDKEQREEMQQAMKFAEESPWPELSTLGTDVFAP